MGKNELIKSTEKTFEEITHIEMKKGILIVIESKE